MAHWTVSDVSTDLKETLVLSDQTVEQQSPTSQSVHEPAGRTSLGRVGYVSHTRNRRVHAPDADVLLSDSFVRTHCFQVAKSDLRHAGWRGSFSLAGAGPPRVLGLYQMWHTWVDRATQELKTDRLSVHGACSAGCEGGPEWLGWSSVHLDSGIWFVSRWSIRMPRTARYDNRDWTPGAFEWDVTRHHASWWMCCADADGHGEMDRP